MNGQANDTAEAANGFWAQIATLVLAAADLVALAAKYVLVTCAIGAVAGMYRACNSMGKRGRATDRTELYLTRPRRGG